MRVAIIGSGFTGLSAGLELVRHGCRVDLFEASDKVGGLAMGFRQKNWQWSAEKFYHHIFTNDSSIIDLSQSLNLEPIFFRPLTAVFWKGKIYPFDSAGGLLNFPGLKIKDKLRMGAVLAGFKLLPNGKFLERWPASWALKKLLGQTGYQTIWEPLLAGKFDGFSDKVNLAWFWARIKKRTPELGTFPGGFQALADRIAQRIIELGGKINLNRKMSIEELRLGYDAVLSTSPSIIHHPSSIIYHLDAHVLLLELKRRFLSDVYWLNILDRRFPFLVVGEHTNFVDSRHFGGSHLVYIGNYLPRNHPLFSLSSTKVFKKFLPWLKKINPRFSEKQVKNIHVFHGPFAQPVATVNYSKAIPSIKQDERVYIATQAMIYPWDRGTNYAVELGQKAARKIIND